MCRTFRIFVQFPLTLCDTYLCGHANKIILLLSFARLQPNVAFDRVYFKISRVDGGTFPINVSSSHTRRITVLSLVLTVLQRDTAIFIFVALLRSF